jgi:hypothetical protein
LRRRKLLLAAVFGAVAILVATLVTVVVTRDGAGGSDAVLPVAAAIGADQRTRLLVPEDGTLLGSWTAPNEKNEAHDAWVDLLNEREELVGRPFDIGHDFHTFEETFPSDLEREHVDAGRIPMISWNGTSAASILRGEHDDLIRERAAALEELGVSVLLRFWWEMDTEQKQEWAPNPRDFAAAWRHVHRLFDEEGAANVAWVWCPTSLAFTKDVADTWWPGDGWVDWVCADGYNFAPAKAGSPWRSFAEIFDPFYEWAIEKGKPIMIGEFGVLERRAGEKAAWLRQAAEDLRDRFPEIRAVVYFDSRRTVEGTVRDWRIDTSPGAAKAFSELADSLEEGVRRR